jgi:hypothetical protein
MKRLAFAAAVTLGLSAWSFGQAPSTAPVQAPAQTPAETAPAASAVKAEAKVCKTVSDRQCQEPGETFNAADGSLACWTKIEGQTGGVVHHVWFKGEQQLGDIELKIGGSPWRVWSKKTLGADAKGDWRVEIRDGANILIETVKFKVQ